MTQVFLNKFVFIKKKLPQYIKNDHKKILTCQKNDQKKKNPKFFVFTHIYMYQSEKK